MSKIYTIKEISELFNIPKSTLRYWESEGLISSIRNDNNNYREYTNDNLVKICDIIFYRNLNIPVKKLSSSWNVSIDESREFFIDSCRDIESQIKELEDTKKKIEQRLENIKIYDELFSNPYRHSCPPFASISHLHLGQTKNVLSYLNDQSVLALAIQIGEEIIEDYGVVSSDTSDEDCNKLWVSDGKEHNYIECLIRIIDRNLDLDYLQKHLDYIDTIGKKPGIILANYLTSDNYYDYFHAWIELL